MKSAFESARILVCVGTGGVGKTTVAAAIGAWEAEKGKRVLVLTIDPSQRLKTTLGLSESGEVKELSHPRIQGSLSAAVVNSKKTFDEFVRRAAGSSEKAEKILKNKLYVQLSTTLSGSQEFTALERLYSAADSGLYDLIVLDTPPAKHASDFLRAPKKLNALFQEGIAKWLRGPDKAKGFFSGILQTGTKQVLKILELLTGSDFVRELSDFFVQIQDWQGRLGERTDRVHRLLLDSKTQFLLICSYDRAKLLEAARFGQQIQENGYHLKTMILNRSFPIWLLRFDPTGLSSTEAGQLALKWKSFFEERKKKTSVVAEMKKQNISVFELPEMSEDISDLDGVFILVDQMKEIR